MTFLYKFKETNRIENIKKIFDKDFSPIFSFTKSNNQNILTKHVNIKDNEQTEEIPEININNIYYKLQSLTKIQKKCLLFLYFWYLSNKVCLLKGPSA